MVALLNTGRTADTSSLTLPSYARFAMHYLLSSDNTVTHVAAFLHCRMHQKHKTSLELIFFFLAVKTSRIHSRMTHFSMDVTV